MQEQREQRLLREQRVVLIQRGVEQLRQGVADILWGREARRHRIGAGKDVIVACR